MNHHNESPEREPTVEERIKALLEEKFDKFEHVSWPSNLPNVGRITLAPVLESELLDVTLTLNNDSGANKAKNYLTFQYAKWNGHLVRHDNVPKHLNLQIEDVNKEVLKVLELFHPESYFPLETTIFDSTDPQPNLPNTTPMKGRGSKLEGEWEERLQFLENQQGLIGIGIPPSRMEDYRPFLFKGGFILENPWYGNAAFAVQFDKPIELPEKDGSYPENIPLKNRLSYNDKINLSKEYLEPIFSEFRTKKELQNRFAGRVRRFIHDQDGEWKEELASVIQAMQS